MKLHQMPFTDQFQQGTKPLRTTACNSNATVPRGVKRKGTHTPVKTDNPSTQERAGIT